jgi:DNA-binding beta-propeller fold protein YncE
LVAFGVYETRSVAVASRYTGLVKTSVVVGEGPRALAWGEGAARLYCANSYTDDVTVLTGDGYCVLRTLPVGDAPFCFAYSPVQRRLYVGHLNSSKVYVIKDTVGGIEEAAAGRLAGTRMRATPSTFTGQVVLSGSARCAAVSVYDGSGREVRVLTADPGADGAWFCVWDGRDGEGREVTAGVYVAMVRGEPQARAKLIKLG